MATLEEVRAALDALVAAGTARDQITILHCNTEYPTPMTDVNLRAMLTIHETLSVPVGYSDHTLGILAPAASVALGARVIEKHFTLDKSLPGTDHVLSVTPDELREMIGMVRQVETLLGSASKEPTASERAIVDFVRSRFPK